MSNRRELINLRAEVAERREDLRIATKHRKEAGARTMSPANKKAYEKALKWEKNRAKAERKARAKLIQAQR